MLGISERQTLSEHNAFAVRTPKLPGEPPRVQPSLKNASNWEDS